MQTNEEHIEQQLWDYIDGLCSDAERQRIALLIEQDEIWARKYKGLQMLNVGIGNDVELEQPHFRFTRNVMDTIAKAHPVAAPKQYLNPVVIRSIAAFFIITIGFLLAYTLFTADWSAAASEATTRRFNLPKVQLHTMFEGNFFNVVIAVNVILGLALLDFALRAKRVQHH